MNLNVSSGNCMITMMSLSNETQAVFNLLQYVNKLNSVIQYVIPFLAFLWKKSHGIDW